MNTDNPLNLTTWDDFKYKHVSPDIIAEADFLADLLGEFIRARDELKITQAQLAEMTGLKQAAISRMERGDAVPRIDTLIKLLVPLGKTIAIVPLEGRLAECAAARANASKKAPAEAKAKPADAAPASHGSGAPYPPGYAPMQAKGRR